MDEYTDLEALSQCALRDMAQVRPVLDKIADKWTILILTVICPRPSRFNEIKRRLDGITHKALADALKRLERNGLVTRTVLPTQPVGVEYAITPLGHSLRQPFEALCSWAVANGDKVEAAALLYDNRANHR
ncbi:helix-turn-helix transcriptional regulator [Rhizobium pusense]|jgi:DNA-binding HxlR family transcriptional regulator|uniref:Helix-turn-helix transcriptional regulator n=2 Tax=Agrobacterium TaxID=357 RepID=A0A1L9C7Y3_9HYPH|nr:MULTISPECIES: helix-turn-helix domain-containing protein [Rhizobium/Agrobacterium group]ANV26667.1 HxlR family transcriptional regulator [Rhizobium sp. S41]AUC12162.1 HxlR family transcriptional regulator [Rhizobium sp. Y9]KGE81662.1 HxlR family transcriptional regulator [Rhizobium sp. H41]MBM7326620.1 helix-turn-helix transcriptional regulator [Agrobacterium sp. S2]MDP9730894.1 DNA-binding HxlR family transcriptional regulator [Rhizobium sp. SORGH_AS_0285]MDP9753050.1 DNA-binding HxlR fam